MADRRMFDREIFKSSVMVHLGCNNPNCGLAAQRVFETLILRADDHGRGRLIPEVIRMEAFASVPEEFAECEPSHIIAWIKQIEKQGALVRYEINGEQYYYLTGWDKYQRGGWQRAKSLLPEPPQESDKGLTGSGQQADLGLTGDESKVNQEKVNQGNKTTAEKTRGNLFVAKWIDLMRKLRDDTYKIHDPGAKQIKLCEKHLNGDLEEFEIRARNYLDSEFVNKPTPAKFYNSIENYKDDESQTGDADY